MSASQPSTTPPEEEEDEGPPRALLRVSQATDILLDPARASAPRYLAYRHARARFWESFPSGRYARLPTPGTDLECGLHALRLSMLHQLPPSVVAGQLPPTLAELRAVYRAAVAVGARDAGAGAAVANDTYFSADQLAAVFAEWGRRQLRDPPLRCQLGYVSDGTGDEAYDGLPVMMGTPELDTAEEGGPDQGIARVWVYNDGWSLRGGVGHFEGIRRPTQDEMERHNVKE